MESWTNLFVEVLKLSPFVAALLYFLMTVWKTMQRKDDALMSTMKDHQASMLLIHEKSITAQNNSADSNRQLADANRQLAGAIGEMKDHLSDKLDDIQGKLPRNGSVRKAHPGADIAKSAA